MMMSTALRATVVAGLLAYSTAARADDAKPLKTEIESYIHRIEASTGGQLHWDGTDTFEVKQSGNTATATIVNAHLSFRKHPGDQTPAFTVNLDRVEVQRAPAASGGNFTEYALSLPALATIGGAIGGDVTVSLKDGRMSFILEAPGDHQHSATFSLGGARIEQKDNKDYLAFGALASTWKIARSDGGGWRAPVDFEIKGLEFLIAEAPLAGTVDRVSYTGEAAGPSLADLDALRDKLAEIREQDSPDQKVAGWLGMLPKLVTVFSSTKGDLVVENVNAKKPDGEPRLALAKASFGGGLSGLDGEKATLFMTIAFDGLTIASSLLPEAQVPRRGTIDFALEDVATSALRTLAEAGSGAQPGASDEAKQKATQQLMIAAMSLNPVLRLREAAVDFKNVQVSATGEAKRAPPLPIGYSATADIAVHGFDALSDIVTSNLARAYLPLLKFIGAAEPAADGTPSVKFHLVSALGQAFSINGSNLSAWLGGHVSTGAGATQPRTLLVTDPPLKGDDVRAVQQALPAAKQATLPLGTYDTATALAVAQFQKDSGLNVDGVVDAKTREKLGIKPPASPAPQIPAPPKN